MRLAPLLVVLAVITLTDPFGLVEAAKSGQLSRASLQIAIPYREQPCRCACDE
jgi:hypothetical protein